METHMQKRSSYKSKREMIRSRDLDLLLLGKTGNGKSKTGNTILGFKAFNAAANATSVTKNIDSDVADYGGRLIKVVDGPGVGDTSGTNQEANLFVMEQLEKAIAINDNGYHAFLLVVRFGIRFERNDKNAVDILKAIFGPDFIRKHCILLFTCGDNFEDEFEEKKTIQEWCQEQSGPLKELYEECGRRAILFNNMTKDAGKVKAQVDELIAMVDNLCISGARYTNEHFAIARTTRKRLEVQDKAALIDQKFMEKLSLLIQQKDRVNQIKNLVDRKDRLQQLLHTEWEPLYQELSKEDQGTGVLNRLLENVKSHRQATINDIDQCNQMIAEEERLMKQDMKIMEEKQKLAREREIREEEEKRRRQRRIREQREIQEKEQAMNEREKKLNLKEQHFLQREVQRNIAQPQMHERQQNIVVPVAHPQMQERQENIVMPVAQPQMQERQQNIVVPVAQPQMQERQQNIVVPVAQPQMQERQHRIVEQKQALARQKNEWQRKVEKRDKDLNAERTAIKESNAEVLFKAVVPAVGTGIMMAVAGVSAPLVAVGAAAVGLVNVVARKVSKGCVIS